MAKPSYFKKIVTRAAAAPLIQPPSGLLTRWSQLAEPSPALARNTPQPPPAVAAISLGIPKLPHQPQPRPPQRDAIREKEDPAPAVAYAANRPPRGTRHEARRAPQAVQRRSGDSPVRQEPPRQKSAPATLGPQQRGASLPPAPTRKATPRNETNIETSVGIAKPTQGCDLPAPHPPQAQKPPAGQSSASVMKVEQRVERQIHERMERQKVMPSEPQAARPVLPPPAKAGAAVHIGTIEVKVIRAAGPAPSPPPPEQRIKPPTTASVPAPAAPTSRRPTAGHGFHQS